MALTVISNKKNTSAVVHVASANATITIAGNSSVSTIAKGDEVLTGAYIAQAIYGSPSAGGYITVKRGANLVATFDSSGHTDYAGNGMALTVDSTADVVVEFVNTTSGYVMLELQKQGANGASDYFQN